MEIVWPKLFEKSAIVLMSRDNFVGIEVVPAGGRGINDKPNPKLWSDD